MPDLPLPASSPQETRDTSIGTRKKRDKRMHGLGERFSDVPNRESRLTEEALERGTPHLDPENPAVWKGSIGGDD